ncbi:MAG: response regulator [Chloroflexota bacterium]|nr:response regulator [Chloroflexota bacterium]
METYGSIEEFAEQVKKALNHLHDYVRLQGCPLCSSFFPDPSLEGPGRAQRFRRLLMETIEELSPPNQVPINSKAWRSYHLLSSRYVEWREPQVVMQELGIGERQFYREQHKAVEALAQLLWEKYQWVEEYGTDEREAGSDEEAKPQTLRGEAERLASKPQRVELKEVVQGVLRVVRPLSRERGVGISHHLEEHLPAIYANRILVRQILIQALSRCITQPEVSGIRVGFMRSRRQIEVEVTVFTSQGTRQSTAQALSWDTAQQLVEMVGGEWRGVTVGQEQYRLRFTLPTSEPRMLLAIEDNPAAVKLLERYLIRQEYQVVGASNGEDALRLAQELEPDVITLDVMIPNQDGWEVLDKLKRDPDTKEIPVLICSVLDEEQVGFALGASAYLKKPFSQAQLLDVLSGLWGRGE